jgi:tetratricopeptide (TPR) repeat protein
MSSDLSLVDMIKFMTNKMGGESLVYSDPAGAMVSFDSSLALLEQRSQTKSPGYVETLFHKGRALNKLGDLGPAEEMLRRALSLAKEIEDSPNSIGSILCELARVLKKKGDPTAAVALFREAVRVLERGMARTPYEKQATLFKLSSSVEMAYLDLGDLLVPDPEALELYSKCEVIRGRTGFEKGVSYVHGRKGLALLAMNRLPEAERALRAAFSVLPKNREVQVGLATALARQDKSWPEVARLCKITLNQVDEKDPIFGNEPPNPATIEAATTLLADAERAIAEKDKKGVMLLSEETRAMLIAELIDEDKNPTSKKTKKKGKK